MHNFFTIEVEAEMRQQELKRSAAADLRAAQASPTNGNRSWLSRTFRPQLISRTLTSPAMPVGALLELPRVPRPVTC